MIKHTRSSVIILDARHDLYHKHITEAPNCPLGLGAVILDKHTEQNTKTSNPKRTERKSKKSKINVAVMALHVLYKSYNKSR